MTMQTDDARPMSPARRRLLIACSGAAVVGVGGAAWVGTRLDGTQAWIEAVVREHLPGIRLDAESLAKFAASMADNRIFKDRKANLAMLLDQSAGTLTRRVAKVDRRVARLERRVLTEFLLGSNFFRVADPCRELIIHGAALPACGNPFATFHSV